MTNQKLPVNAVDEMSRADARIILPASWRAEGRGSRECGTELIDLGGQAKVFLGYPAFAVRRKTECPPRCS